MDTAVLTPQEWGQAKKEGIQNDFSYGSNVGSSHIYIRMGFLRKVYGLLSVQLLVTTIVAATVAYTPVLRDTIHSNPLLLMFVIIMSFVLLFALHVKRHHVPINLFLLGGFTIVEAIAIGIVVSVYEAKAVLKALVLTLIITGGLTAYTFQTKRDFTNTGAGLSISLFIIIGLGVMNVFMGSRGLELALAGGSALIFCLFVVFDTQQTLMKLSPEEYILATINLYLDILNLFLELLRLMKDDKRK